MTIYSREVIDEPITKQCNICEKISECSSGTLLFKGYKSFGLDGYVLSGPCEFIIHDINYCPKCGRKLK